MPQKRGEQQRRERTSFLDTTAVRLVRQIMNNMNYLTEILLGALSLSSELLSFFVVVSGWSVECGQRHGTQTSSSR